MDYEKWLHDSLVDSAKATNHTDLDFKVWKERDFEYSGNSKLQATAKTISVVVKDYPSSIVYNIISQSRQIMAWSEGDDIQAVGEVLRYFATTYNYFYNVEVKNGKSYSYKHQYTTPTILDGFQDHGILIRAEYAISSTVVEMDDIADVSCTINGVTTQNAIAIDGVAYNIFNFTYAYTAMTNTTNEGNKELSNTISKSATLGVSFGIPAINSVFLTKALSQNAGNISSDTKYALSFSVGTCAFIGNFTMTTASFTSSPDNSPSYIVGLIL